MTSMALKELNIRVPNTKCERTFNDPLWGFVILGLNLNLGPLSLFCFFSFFFGFVGCFVLGCLLGFHHMDP